MASTVSAIERELVVDGLVRRYDTGATDDGLPPGEGLFLACSFWLADAYHLIGRDADAQSPVRTGLSIFATMSACSQKNTTFHAVAWSETFRKPFRISPW